MSSITKNWTEADFRKELQRLDQYVKRTQGIDLEGAEFVIELSQKLTQTLGLYYRHAKKFVFSLPFFNSDVPESCAMDVIRHEYAHYYAEAVFGYRGGHGTEFKKACRVVGANPSTYYSRRMEFYARRKEEQDAKVYKSKTKVGQEVYHPFFGDGRVIAVEHKKTTAILKVDFCNHGVRDIDEVWLDKNGII